MFDRELLQKMQRNAQNDLVLLLLGGPLFMGHPVPHEVSIFPKFHKDWAKIVDFLHGHSDFKIAFLIKLQL